MSGHDDDTPIDRSLIDAALPALESTDADKARVRRAVLGAIASSATVAGAASAQATTAAASTSAGSGLAFGLAWKVGLGIVAIGAVAGAVSLGVGTRAPEHESAPSVAPPVPEPAHVDEAPVEPAAETAPAIAAPPDPVARRERPPHATAVSTAPPTQSAPEVDSVLEEARLVARANAAIEAHDGVAALAILAEHARRFPEGQLREERFADRILALCETGDVERARREAASFLNVFPASLHAEAIRASCVGSP